MNGTAFCVLAEVAPSANAQLYLPMVAYHEILEVYSRELHRIHQKLHSCATDWDRLVQAPEISIPSRDSLVQKEVEFHEYLDRRLAGLHINILPLPEISHEDLIIRALKHRKPFDQNGKGYRDALIWFSLVHSAHSDVDEVYLVTENTKDFGPGPKPYPDMAKDLESEGIAPDRVRIVTSLDSFIENHLVPHLGLDTDLAVELSRNEGSGRVLRDWLKSSLGNEIESQNWANSLLGLEPDHGWVMIDNQFTVNKVKPLRVIKLPTCNQAT